MAARRRAKVATAAAALTAAPLPVAAAALAAAPAALTAAAVPAQPATTRGRGKCPPVAATDRVVLFLALLLYGLGPSAPHHAVLLAREQEPGAEPDRQLPTDPGPRGKLQNHRRHVLLRLVDLQHVRLRLLE